VARLGDCLEAALAAGRLTKEQAARVAKAAAGYERQLVLDGMGPADAASAAAKKALDGVAKATALAKRQAQLQAVAVARATNRARAHVDGTGAGIASILARDVRGRRNPGNVDYRTRAILAQSHAKFADGLEKLRTRALGFWQDKQLLQDTVRELFGQGTGNGEAAIVAKLWGEVSEQLRVRFNRAGGNIAKREDWGMPQHHDQLKVMRAAGVGKTPLQAKRAWLDFVLPRLDRAKMVDADGVPMGDQELMFALDHAYDSIATDGLIDLTPGRQAGGKVANRHQHRRFLAFKDGDAWMEYQERFGAEDLFHVFTSHMEVMAREIALLELLGPNPAHTFRYLLDLAKKDGASALELRYLESLWDVTSGSAGVNSDVRLADAGQTIRNLLTSTRLGAATLSAVTDLGFIRQTAAWNGMSATKVFARQLSLLNPANEADRLLAVRAGLAADAWTRTALAANRFTDVTGYGFSARAADFTMRASGLTAWTDAGRKAFGIEFLGHVADHQGKTLDKLPEELKRFMDAYGISAKEWDVIRATEPLDFDGAKVFSFEKLLNRTDLDEATRQALTSKLQEGLLTETTFAIPEPDARGRVITTAGTARGTAMGELVRSATQFKSFPVSIVASHLMRAGYAGWGRGTGYIAGLTIGTTVMGAVALQLKDVSKGLDPRPMDNARSWAAAYAQGGGLGILGDFLYADANRFDQGPIATLLGPSAGLVNDVWKLTTGNAQQALRGEETHFADETIRFLASNTPGSSLWYARLAYEREVADQLRLLADPAARGKMVERERRRYNDTAQGYWWRPGEAAPERAPDLKRLNP